jgi:hypothetical protein
LLVAVATVFGVTMIAQSAPSVPKDSYENDGTTSLALAKGASLARGEKEIHSFDVLAESDWTRLYAYKSSGTIYVYLSSASYGITASLKLYNSAGTTLLAQSGSWSISSGTYLSYVPPADGYYWVLAKNSAGTGLYLLSRN